MKWVKPTQSFPRVHIYLFGADFFLDHHLARGKKSPQFSMGSGGLSRVENVPSVRSDIAEESAVWVFPPLLLI